MIRLDAGARVIFPGVFEIRLAICNGPAMVLVAVPETVRFPANVAFPPEVRVVPPILVVPVKLEASAPLVRTLAKLAVVEVAF